MLSTPFSGLSAFGAYYPTQFEWPISAPPLEGFSGFGALGQPPPNVIDAGMNALLTILKGSGAIPGVSPLYTLTVWGTRTSDVDWVETTRPEFDYLTYGISDGALELAKSVAGLPGWIAILFDDLLNPTLVKGAFIDTPYQYHSLEAVYDQKDPAATPRIRFLAWGNLRDSSDPGGGHASMEQAARSLGGQLVFPIQVQHGTGARAAPSSSFATAMKNQFGVTIGPSVVPPPPTGRPSGQAPPPADRSMPGTSVVAASAAPSWLVPAGVGLVMFVGGFFISRSMASNKRRRRR
jgi:hypothetical protein